MDTLLAICPLDGRYSSRLSTISNYASEFGLIKYRLIVEIKWFKFLLARLNHKSLTNEEGLFLNKIIQDFDLNEANKIKAIEQQTNHDVKALEYYIKAKLDNMPSLSLEKELVHFACTSEDINNTSYALMLKDLVQTILLPKLKDLTNSLNTKAQEYKDVAIMSRTHGQAATPSTMGKEIYNFYYRINRQINQLEQQEYLAKINGAVGNYNAHLIAYPNLVWNELAQEFIEKHLKLNFNPYTTQIEPHDYQAEIYDNLRRINTILIDLARDMWGYISLNYFKQKLKPGEVGSSTMPHKVNPIDFENAEGNFGLANSLLGYLSQKLPISRFQRDLTDSTVQRNIGLLFGYTFLALDSLLKGLSKVEINLNIINQDLDNNWELLAEAIQTVLRKHKKSNAYELLKDLTRGNKLNKERMQEFILSLDLPDEERALLLQLSPHTYIGLANKLF